MNQENGLKRREFMRLATWTIGILLSAGFTVPAVAYLIGPALQDEEREAWLPIGPTNKVELGTPTLFRTRIERRTGWIVNEEELTVYVLTENGREYSAMSNICTHLGCRVRWISDHEQFFCPCHNAVFGKDGSVLSGPPPRPLDRFEVKVEEDQLYILGG
jgi:menaquinol-cytochrome c reductase iron-sulfur subunit